MKVYELLTFLKEAQTYDEILIQSTEEQDMYAKLLDVKLKHKRVVLIPSESEEE